jgi:hypothetical protein
MFINIFFGKVDKHKILDTDDTVVSFWGSDNYFILLQDPINSEHGVFQYYADENNDSFWWTLDGLNFSKASQQDFVQIISESLKKIDDKQFLAQLFDYLCVSLADPFEIEDTYYDNSFCIEDTNSLDISEYSNYDESCENLWVFEITRYANPPVEIKGDELSFLCETTEDELEMKLRFMFCIEEKKA